jgi:prophage regulatory protein
MNQILSNPLHQYPHETGNLPANPTTERLLPLSEVEFRTGFKSSFIYQLIKEGKFPKPIKIGTSSRWRESEVQAWIAKQIQNSQMSSQNNCGVPA